MNKTYKLLLVFILLVFTNGECLKQGSGRDTRLHILNKSNNNIFFWRSFSYPDTSLPVNNNISRDTLFDGFYQTIIKPGDSGIVSVASSWDYFLSTQVPSGKIEIFLFDLNVLRTTPWKTIAANYMVLKRYDLTLDSLKNRNWEIDYP